ncbi:MAG: winged helix-turn-helix domain-containing protein [Candidatus Caldatribacteriota bacterium]|nr:winged helix-turn-helix domain-containing protein [Candidatus Caldatribacteriota bacterium]
MKHRSVADIAYEVLARHKKPLHYRKITEELIKIKPLKVKEPYYAVNASMSGDKRFVRTKRGIWGLLKWKYKNANIKYSVTSYGLKGGAMFLTSYMRPFFPRDKKLIEITFIDKEANDIKAVVNNEFNYIAGIDKWYKEKNIKVNDVIYLGLIDFDKRKYFLVTEDETKLEPKEEIREKIYKILKEENHPLPYEKIRERALGIESEGENLFSGYIINVLKNNSQFIEEKENIWGLFDWLSESEKLQRQLIYCNDNEKYKDAIKKVFDFLGFETSFVYERKASFILAKAVLNCRGYNILIDGKLTGKKNEKTQTYEYWNELKIAKNKNKTDFEIIISLDFDYDKFENKKEQAKVILLESRWLESIIKEHNRLTFSLDDLKIVFSQKNSPESNLFKLFEKRKVVYKKIKLIKSIIDIFKKNSYKKLDINIKLLTEIINKENNGFSNTEMIDEFEVKKIVKILSLTPLNILKNTETNKIVLNFKPELAKVRINKIISEIF